MEQQSMTVMSHPRPMCPVCNKCVKKEVTLSIGDKVGFTHTTGGGNSFNFSAREGVLSSIYETEVTLIYRKKLVVAPKRSVTDLNGFNGLTVAMCGVCEC